MYLKAVFVQGDFRDRTFVREPRSSQWTVAVDKSCANGLYKSTITFSFANGSGSLITH